MSTVKQLASKERDRCLFSIAQQHGPTRHLSLMSEKGCGALLVLEDDNLAGIFSERDFARKVLSESCALDQPVERYMTTEVYAVKPETSIDECMSLMTQKKFRHLPVLEGDKLVGVISIGDIVKDVIANKDVLIRSLENYIVGHDYNQ